MLASVFIQEYFRIRSGDTVGLNVDSGWAAAENANATIGTGLEFRIRFKVRETAGGDTSGVTYKLQVKRNAGAFVDLDILGGLTAPAVQAVLSSQYADGDAATELLTNTTTYVNGEGLEDNLSGGYSLTSEELELEFCLMIMSFHDGPTQNVASDTLEFRVVESDGTVFGGTYTNPTITVSETAGYIGGAFAETPVRVGPYADANGKLYGAIEPAESQNDCIMIASTDGGDTWREMDGAGRPTDGDLEGFDLVQIGDTLHALLHDGTKVSYHRFTTSDHSTSPDEWTIIDEEVATPTSFTTQSCSLAVLSDTRIRAFYLDGTSPRRVRYKTRSSGGTWGSEQTVDSEASKDFQSPSCVLGESDLVHLFYKDDTDTEGELFHRSLNSSDTLSDRESISTIEALDNDDNFPQTEPIYYDDGGVEVITIAYSKGISTHVFTRTIRDDASPGTEQDASDVNVILHQGGSHQVGASLCVDGKIAHLLYIHASDNDISHDENDDEGGWGTDTEVEDAVTAHWVRGLVFTHSSGNGGDRVLGYLWDDGSDGGTGRVKYNEVVLVAGGAASSLFRQRQTVRGAV